MSTVKVCLLSVAMIEIMKKTTSWGGKGLFCLTTNSPPGREVKAVTKGKNLGAWTEAETTEEWCLLFSLHGLQRELPAFFQQHQHHLPRSSTSHSELKHPTSFTDQENTCRLAYSTIWGMRFLFSDDLSLCLAKQATCTPTWPVCLSPWKPLVHSLILWIQLY